MKKLAIALLAASPLTHAHTLGTWKTDTTVAGDPIAYATSPDWTEGTVKESAVATDILNSSNKKTGIALSIHNSLFFSSKKDRHLLRQ
ncbi:hypothetical protein [Vibrio breoganii]|uniref:hypothetical protein n=1 Tax=Vibrio breoganii TaxID=553239 RepID=UPI000C86855D|nr:hypothetical protein [Vibrio breoganii]PMG94264.1 hypothetical protein BCU79_12320 [Vibrio breoganii]PMI16078.1 hypothetical protein BCU49_01900 [Vibrio breoganii]PMJ46091.1 hypothetical protein BCU21_11940 [Vibrio breoganii]PMK55023.1 hypothetical protein BCT97_00590 [Vibrio breoganii]PMM89698.1 hypothetical protein BCT44_16695 [Vibrio breoganii]